MSTSSTPNKCKHCGVNNPSSAHYCAHCGKPLDREYSVVDKSHLEYLEQQNDQLLKRCWDLKEQVDHFLPNRIKRWWSNNTLLGWGIVLSSILAIGFAIYFAFGSGHNEPSAKAAVGAVESSTKAKGAYQTKIDSVSYLMGLNFGSYWKNYDFGELRWKRVSKGMTDYLQAKGNPKSDGFDDQLEIGTRLLDSVLDSYRADRREGVKSSRAKRDSAAYLLGVNFGSFLVNAHFGALDNQIIKKGVDDFLSAEGNPADSVVFNAQFKVNANEIDPVFNGFLAERKSRIARENLEKETAFLAENRGKEGIVELPSGLQYTILDAGNARKKPRKNSDIVLVNYTGTLLDGSVFNETADPDKGDRFSLSKVIKGWQEGLKLIGEGGSIRLYVPAQLAYGDDWNDILEPNSTLVFDVQLTKVIYGR